jgi:hypothetical protein
MIRRESPILKVNIDEYFAISRFTYPVSPKAVHEVLGKSGTKGVLAERPWQCGEFTAECL